MFPNYYIIRRFTSYKKSNLDSIFGIDRPADETIFRKPTKVIEHTF